MLPSSLLKRLLPQVPLHSMGCSLQDARLRLVWVPPKPAAWEPHLPILWKLGLPQPRSFLVMPEFMRHVLMSMSARLLSISSSMAPTR